MPVPRFTLKSIRSVRFVCGLAGAMCLLAMSQTALAATIYVDNLLGSDTYNGIAQKVESATTGPMRSVSGALRRARPGDRIVVHNTGKPYYESLRLSGRRHSGLESFPLIIESDGAIIDGSRAVPDTAWQNVSGDVWRIKPWRKGYYQLLSNGKPLPGTITPRSATKLPAIPAGHWTAWKGSIYYRAAALDSPLNKNFRFAFHRVGLSLYSVERVHVRGLMFRGFQLDGINAHDLCDRILLENLKVEGNARAGIAVGGTASIVVRNCEISGNRLHSALVTELGGLIADKSRFDKPPTLKKR